VEVGGYDGIPEPEPYKGQKIKLNIHRASSQTICLFIFKCFKKKNQKLKAKNINLTHPETKYYTNIFLGMF